MRHDPNLKTIANVAYRYADKTIDQIAEFLGVPSGTVGDWARGVYTYGNPVSYPDLPVVRKAV